MKKCYKEELVREVEEDWKKKEAEKIKEVLKQEYEKKFRNLMTLG